MSTDRPTRDSMSLEEATISDMWEIAGAHCTGVYAEGEVAAYVTD